MAQSWHDLLFAHWRVDPARIAALLPRGLEPDLHEGAAWLGVVPFRMAGVRLRFAPGIPTARAFLELNVRTYVRAGATPAVWFFSLDAASRIAVRAARRSFRLPYHTARMTLLRGTDGTVTYRCERRTRAGPRIAFSATYAPSGPAFAADPGSLEHFLVERYALVARGSRGLLVAPVHHAPWPLQPALARIEENSMAAPLGLELAPDPDHLLASSGVYVLAGAPRPLATT